MSLISSLLPAILSLRILAFVFVFLHLFLAVTSNPLPRQLSAYAPRVVPCPTDQELTRAASAGLSPAESVYIKARKQKASANLVRWLQSVSKDFTVDASDAPVVALATSGGGYRSMLLGGGIVQAFDARESKAATAGLYQSLLYHGGLSGGSWLLSSIFGNGDGLELISNVSAALWEPALKANVLFPTNQPTAQQLDAIKADFAAKQAAGFPPTTAEAWGRLLGWQLLSGPDGGVEKTMSGIAASKAFQEFNAPVPVITALGVDDISGDVCDARDNATTYEFTPFEFGSWDVGVAAFTPMHYLGSKIRESKPSTQGKSTCVEGFDNLGFILGTSSSKFNEGCGSTIMSVIADGLDPILEAAHAKDAKNRRDLYAPYPNPFRFNVSSAQTQSAEELYLVDGGQALQNNPIWPFIQPTRNIDVLIVNDNSADTDDNWPNGTEILRTYTRAQEAGLTRMPPIPSVDVFAAQNLTKKAVFFGCGLKDKLTIVYLPNVGYNGTESNVPSAQFDYEQADVRKMINNGGAIATQGGDAEWPTCLGCVMLEKKKGRQGLPGACTTCLQRYCFEGEG